MPDHEVSTSPVSWRDVYGAVEQSETRLTKHLERIEAVFANHEDASESRYREVETRVRVLENDRAVNAAAGLSARRTLGDLRTVVLLIVAIAAFMVSLMAVLK
jgi:uncharacterized membrane protein